MSALRNVVVERDGDGVLVVCWHADVPVDVSVGATPVAVEHTSHGWSVAGGSLRLETSLPRRAYVSLRPRDGPAVVVAERRCRSTGSPTSVTLAGT